MTLIGVEVQCSDKSIYSLCVSGDGLTSGVSSEDLWPFLLLGKHWS